MFAVSVNPSLLCNFTCNFCYLSPSQLKDKKRISIDLLYDKLKEVDTHKQITHIDLYGGEVSLLPEDYMEEVLFILELFTPNINVITNLSRPVKQWMLKDNITLSVSWDYVCRERWDKVIQHIVATPKDVHVLMLASECVINWTNDKLEEAIHMCDQIGNIRSVEIKPYSTNQSNADAVTFKQYEEFIKRWLRFSATRNYEFVNDRQLRKAIDSNSNSYSDDHIYINPNGKLAVLDFDEKDNEFFLELNSITEYEEWVIKEKERVNANVFCSRCKYLGNCLSEHLRNVTTLTNSCNGFKHLLDWYAIKRP